MPEPLNYVELEKVVDKVLAEIGLDLVTYKDEREIILAALTTIAQRAFTQAARPWEWNAQLLGPAIGHSPPVPLSEALAALEKPEEAHDAT